MDFYAHIHRLRNARRSTEQILEVACPGHNAAEATLGLAWEALFELFCQDEAPDIAQLNTLSAIIHKLVGAFTQLKSLEIKVRDADIKQAEFELKRQQLEDAVKQTAKPGGLTPETLQEIERRLNLL